MQAHHGVVRRETELRSNASDGHAVDDHATENHRVLGLELFGLHEHTPAIDLALVERRELELVDRHHGDLAFSQLVVEHVAYDTVDPSGSPSWVSNLLGTLERPLERDVEHLFRIDLSMTTPTHERQQLLALRAESGADGIAGRAGVDVGVHDSAHRARDCLVVQPRSGVRFDAAHRPGREEAEVRMKFKRAVLMVGFGVAAFAVGPPVALANM
jgi:hypothetical protein